MPTKIAVVGGGAAGVAICQKLFERIREVIVNNNRCLDEEPVVAITVFENSAVVGPGLPFSSPYNCHILNFPKEIMKSAFDSKALSDVKEDVKDDRANLSNSFLNTEYPPRYLFGEFLTARAKQIRQEAKKIGIAIEYRTNTEVLSVEMLDKEHFEIETSTATVTANYVVFCTGNFQSNKYCEFIDTQGYWHNPYGTEKEMDNLDLKKDIVIIGSQKTAIDLALRLCTQNNLQGKVVMVSRSGLLPAVYPKEFTNYQLKFLPKYIKSTKGHLSLDALLSLVLKEISTAEGVDIDFGSIAKSNEDISALEWLDEQINEADVSLKPWQQVLSSVFSLIPTFWHRLSQTDQKTFMEEYYSLFMAYEAGIPQEEAMRIRKLIKDGRLYVFGGLKSITSDDVDQFVVQFKNGTVLTTNQLFNATGSGHDIRTVSLYRSMWEEGSIARHPIGGIALNAESLCVLDREGKQNDRMFAIGELTRGVVLCTGDIRLITSQADIIARNITKKMAA